MATETHAMTVRLNAADLQALDDYRLAHQLDGRSTALRHMIRASSQTHMMGIVTEAVTKEARQAVRNAIEKVVYKHLG